MGLSKAVGKIAVVEDKIQPSLAKPGGRGQLIDKGAGVGDGSQGVQHTGPVNDASPRHLVLFVHTVVIGDMDGDQLWGQPADKISRRLMMRMIGIHAQPGTGSIQQCQRFLGGRA